jgi:hypothetical protein
MGRKVIPMRYCLSLIVLALVLSSSAYAQNRVRTETIRPPSLAVPPAPQPVAPAQPNLPAEKFKADAHVVAPGRQVAANPPIITDLSRLPAAVARTRDRIIAAARTGDLQRLVGVMQASNPMPVFSFSEDKDPIAFWKATYPDSEGIEALSILLTILDTGYVHVDQGTPQEIYLWPYFARLPLKTLTPEQRVELFRIVTGADYHDMIDFGAYSFYRLGIAPDGTWHFFVTGD